MTSHANALQKAIWQALTGNAALTAKIGSAGVHDRLLPKKDMPYLLVAGFDSTDASCDGAYGEEHRLVLEVWSAADGRAEAQEIAGLVRSVLHAQPLTLTGAVLANLRHEQTRVSREPKTRAHVAAMTFRAVTE